MARPNDREVPAIEGGDLGLVEPLADGYHGRVDEPEVEISVRTLELRCTHKISLREVLKPVRTPGEVVEKDCPRLVAEELDHPVVDLHENGRRDHERLIHVLD